MRAVFLASVIAVGVACSSSTPAPPAATVLPAPVAVSQEPTAVTIGSKPTVAMAKHPELGSILVDGGGLTLYLNTRDNSQIATCTGGCARTWPPLLASQVNLELEAGEGVNSDLFGTLPRGDGSSQVSYNGHPLYKFAADNKPGDAVGQGASDIWFVVSPAGEAVKPKSSPAGSIEPRY